jgi:putative ABC transport system permease protein
LKGDFLELYELRRREKGRTKADLGFLWDTLTVVPLRLLVKEKRNSKTHVYMFRTNLKIAQRNLLKNRLYTAINLVGLSVSLAICILITLFVRNELSFDKYLPESDNIYRIVGNYSQGGDSRVSSAATSYMLQPLLESNMKEGAIGVNAMVRVDIHQELVTIDGDRHYMEPNVVFADSTFFKVFAFPFVAGDPSSALDDPGSVVLDQTTAQKYFGDSNPIGQSVSIRDKHFTVSGVIAGIPDNTHFDGQLFFPMSGVSHWYQEWVRNDFSGTSLLTYFKADAGFVPSDLDTLIKRSVAAIWPSQSAPTYKLQPITAIHLESNLQNEAQANGSMTTVRIFMATALVILILACINYINLSMAGALSRSKEAGVKRVLGATPRMQISQFQTESMLVITVSAIVATFLAWLAMPAFNELSGKSLVFNPFSDSQIGLGILTVVLLIGLVAGTFPALVLLKMGTRGMLTGQLEFKGGKSRSGSWLRNGLIIFQFAIAITLITCTGVVMDQIGYMRNKDLGVNADQILLIPLQTNRITGQYELLRDELLRNPSITHVTASNAKVTNRIGGWRGYKVNGAAENAFCPTIVVSHDFFETLGAHLISGRSFSKDFPSDYTEAYILNESAVKFFDLDGDPLGVPIQGLAFTGSKWSTKNARIIGVVKDFHFASLHTEVQPMVFSLASEITAGLGWMEVRMHTDNIKETVASIEQLWGEVAPERPFQFEFMDEALQQHYEAEERFMNIFATFSALSILMGALGLFGLTAFMARRRIREISIRKVLGASVSQLVSLLSVDFLKLVLIANLIGWPIAWYLMKGWLENFAYSAGMSPSIFIITALGAVLLAFAAVLYHTLKASRSNPVKSLRSE